MRINFKFEAPIIQVQIIFYICNLLEVRMHVTSAWEEEQWKYLHISVVTQDF